MINSITDTVTVNILDREFKIRCPKDKVTELKKAAVYLNDKMQEVHHGNKLITIDRVAVTAALNIAHELILAYSDEIDQSFRFKPINDSSPNRSVIPVQID
ncbi:cell division protein ZapA [Gammaproteobacteria bacterium]